MQLASLDLPKIHLSDNGQHLDLSLEGSLKLLFPDGIKVPQTSTDLLKLVAEEHLWIARIGSCHFDVIVSIQGERVTAGNHIAELIGWIQYSEVWTKAGIRLQGCERGMDEPLGKISFSIQHPDLSSALVTPKDAPTAEFQSVSCYIDVSPAKPSLKRKRVKATRDAIDTSIRDESIKHLRQMVDIALELMVLGSRKQYKDITTNTYTWAECLTQLAPAVFSMQYLKIIYDRASLLPIIATSLARMKNAESPSLRYKTATFAARIIENSDRGDCVIRGIEKGAWDVLLSSVKAPTRSRKARLEGDAQSEAIVCKPNIMLPQIEGSDDGNKLPIPIGECPQVESNEMRDILFQPFQLNNSTFLDSRQCNMKEVKAAEPVLFSGSPGGNLETGANCIMDDPEMTPMRKLDYPITPDSSSPYYAIDCGIPSLDVRPLTTFDDWLCSGEFTTEYTDVGAACEPTISSGYDEHVYFYKSYE